MANSWRVSCESMHAYTAALVTHSVQALLPNIASNTFLWLFCGISCCEQRRSLTCTCNLYMYTVFHTEGEEPGISHPPKLKFLPSTFAIYLYYFPTPRASCPLPCHLKNHDSVWNIACSIPSQIFCGSIVPLIKFCQCPQFCCLCSNIHTKFHLC